jgi:hypothetical protein
MIVEASFIPMYENIKTYLFKPGQYQFSMVHFDKTFTEIGPTASGTTPVHLAVVQKKTPLVQRDQ